MASQADKAKRFKGMHEARAGFVLPNPWDRGSARMMAAKGFQALATSSAAHANALARPDYGVTLEEALAHARDIVEATDLPVSADFENGFADRPEHIARNVALAIETGLAGCSIEDASRDKSAPIYPLDLAVERVAAAVQAARRSGLPFVITARAENFLAGRRDLDDTIKRLQAFEKVGADVVYATGLTRIEDVRAIVGSVQVPVNVMAMKTFTVPQLLEAGVRRVSLGPWFARAAMAGLLAAIDEVQGGGTLGFIERCPTGAEINKLIG